MVAVCVSVGTQPVHVLFAAGGAVRGGGGCGFVHRYRLSWLAVLQCCNYILELWPGVW